MAKWLFQKPPTPCGSLVPPLHSTPGPHRLEETLRLSMYWKGLRATVQSHVKSVTVASEQLKYGDCHQNLQSPTLGRHYVWTSWDRTPSRARTRHKLTSCASHDRSCNKLVRNCRVAVSQLQQRDIPTGQRSKDTHVQEQQPYFDKASATVGNLVNRTWFSRYPRSQYIIIDNGSEFKLHERPSVNHTRKPTSVKTLKRMQYSASASNNHGDALHS
eukprot:CCRYP_008538-RA/>CCRYP_008538-RA protein AED:0.33 eAED:0.72 QI:0/0/0/1/0/0/4/0/215